MSNPKENHYQCHGCGCECTDMGGDCGCNFCACCAYSRPAGEED